ncbi:MAG: cytochrome c3 family protein [Thermodesulfobacteriota bacterium]
MNIQRKCITGLFGAMVLVGLLLSQGGQAIGEEPYDEDTYGPEAPIIFTQPVKAVIFSHKTHTMDAGLSCDSCHDDLFQMAIGTAEANDDFTMQSLYDGKYCGACHDGQTAFASNTRCTVCHIGVKGFDRLQGGGTQPAGHGGGH